VSIDSGSHFIYDRHKTDAIQMWQRYILVANNFYGNFSQKFAVRCLLSQIFIR